MMQANGTQDTGVRTPEVVQAFWDRVDRSGDCWLWRLSTGSHGYGQWYPPPFGTNWLTHRLAWTITVGDIPDGLTIDHLCRERRCVRPDHLRLVSNEVNARDGHQLRKTHCPKGHLYDRPNTYIDPKGHRRCRACAKLRRVA